MQAIEVIGKTEFSQEKYCLFKKIVDKRYYAKNLDGEKVKGVSSNQP